jgi:hypothetical protein
MESFTISRRATRASAALALVAIAALLLSLVAVVRPALADPPGNNGTVKIDGVEFDNAPDNEPHVGCTFQVDFYGFDAGDLNADVTFEAQPPTGTAVLLTDTVAIGEDSNAGGGSEAGLDASVTYDLSDALATFTPHPQQGFHVKLTINADGSQGADTKHKVFWVTGCGGEQGESSLTLTKVDQDGAGLPDVAFTLTSTADTSVTFTMNTDENGALTFTGLGAGTYTLSETAPQDCTGIADVTVDLATDGTVTLVGDHAGVTLDENGNLVVENNCETPPVTPTPTPGGSEQGQIMIMKHVCPAGLTPEEFDQIATFGEKVFTCPVVTLPGNEADLAARDASDLADSPFPDGTTDFDFSVAAGGSTSTLADASFMPMPADCPETGDCIEVSHYVFDVARGMVTVTETAPPQDYTFGRVLFTPNSGDDATLVSASANGVIVLDTSADDSVMLHVYNFTGEGGVSPATGTPAPTASQGEGTNAPEQGVQGTTGVPNTATGDPSASLLLMLLAAILIVASGVSFAAINVRARRRR